ncbi:MAG: EI24 domain-containing protein [Desulfobacterales bacterium]
MFVKELFAGITSYKKANQVISEYRLWPWLAIPGILSLCYILMLAILGVIYFSGMSEYVNENWIPGFIRGDTMVVIVSILLWLFLIVIGYLSYQQIVLIFFSPILGFLSEIVEKRVYNQEPPQFQIKNFFRDIIRSFVINARNIGWMLFLTLMAWLVGIFPLIGAILSPLLIFVIQSYYGGFGLIDYTLERKRYTVSESIDFVHKNRAMVTGVGMGFILLLLIPLIGWFFAPGYGAAAATLAALEKINQEPAANEMQKS